MSDGSFCLPIVCISEFDPMKAYEGKNISTIKDAWQKRHPGPDGKPGKLDTAKYGFKNFSMAMKTIQGLTLEHHVDKQLTFLAFFTGLVISHVHLTLDRSRKLSIGILLCWDKPFWTKGMN